MKGMEVVVIAPHGRVDLTALGDVPDRAHVSVVCWEGAAADVVGLEVVGVPAPRGIAAFVRSRLERFAALHVVLRSLFRLSGFDEGRWFWRAASAAPQAAAAIAQSRIVIAADRDAVYTAWHWGRRIKASGRPIASVYGYTAGRAALDEAEREDLR